MKGRRYTVRWARAVEPHEVLECRGLTARVAFARLLGALRASGAIIVHGIEAERG